MTTFAFHLPLHSTNVSMENEGLLQGIHKKSNNVRVMKNLMMILTLSSVLKTSHGYSTPLASLSAIRNSRTCLIHNNNKNRLGISTHFSTSPFSTQRKAQKRRNINSFLSNSSTARSSDTSTSLKLLEGIESNVDNEILAEEAESALAPAQIALREIQENGASVKEAAAAFKQRMADMSGDVENKIQLFKVRGYANSDVIDAKAFMEAPTLDDLYQKPASWKSTLWVQAPFRLLVLVGTYQIFPFLASFFGRFVALDAETFQIISSTFVEALGVLYGTYLALTLKILYERQASVQENSVREASLLSVLTQNLLSLFYQEKDEILARETLQIVADQVKTLIGRTRGAEILSLMRADPYSKILGIIDHYQKNTFDPTPQKESLIEAIRRDLPLLTEARDLRLSQEASSLPSTHYVVLFLLTILSLLAFLLASITEADETGAVPDEARVLFMGLTAVYILCYNFSVDLNDPFSGVFQIKRSSTATYLLQVKWLISNQPFGKDIRFTDSNTEEEEEEAEESRVLAAVGAEGLRTVNTKATEEIRMADVKDRWKSVVRAAVAKNTEGITEEMWEDIGSTKFRSSRARRKKRRRKRR